MERELRAAAQPLRVPRDRVHAVDAAREGRSRRIGALPQECGGRGTVAQAGAGAVPRSRSRARRRSARGSRRAPRPRRARALALEDRAGDAEVPQAVWESPGGSVYAAAHVLPRARDEPPASRR